MSLSVKHLGLDMVILAGNQTWTDEDIKNLREMYNVYYNKGVIAIRVLKRKSGNPLFQVAVEDDGCLQFLHNRGMEIDSKWAQDLIDVTALAMKSSMK